MNVTALKNKLHQLIENTEDEKLLNELYRKMSPEEDTEMDWWEGLDESQQQRILESEKQMENSEVVSNETVLKKIQGWLTK